MASTFFYLYIILFYFILFWQLFNQTATLFQHLVTNTPESIMPGGITTKGRIEHQLKVFGELTTAYVDSEVKFKAGTPAEYLNAVGQMIAMQYLLVAPA